MGQKDSLPQKVAEMLNNNNYALDVRMVQQYTSLPSYFSSSTQKIVQQINELTSKIPPHPLESYLIHCLDIRYSKFNSVNLTAVKQGKSSIQILAIDQSKFEHKHWYELQNKERFLKTLTVFQRQFDIESLIQKQYRKQAMEHGSQLQIQSGFQTLRKPLKGCLNETSQMDQGLIMRLLYHYYLVIIKTYANSGQKHVFRFHDQTGRQLCLMILHGYLSLEELYELFYYMVYIDKHPQELTTKLAVINQLYHYKCLKTCHTINVDKRRLQQLQTNARLYLDELYLNSIRQAEDPQIRGSDDTLMPIKVFPISRVKDKPRVI